MFANVEYMVCSHHKKLQIKTNVELAIHYIYCCVPLNFKEMNKVDFNNGDLSFDIEKIESFDVPITVAKAYDQNLDYPFAIDVEDGSYFYPEQKERDEDFEKLKSIMPKFSFVEL
jgi:hypothetical protein